MTLVFSEFKEHFPLSEKYIQFNKEHGFIDHYKYEDIDHYKYEDIDHVLTLMKRALFIDDMNKIKELLKSNKNPLNNKMNMLNVLISTKKNLKPQFWRWTIDVAETIANRFGCKSYIDEEKISISFLGMESVVVCATKAFIKVCTLIDREISCRMFDIPKNCQGYERAVLIRNKRIEMYNNIVIMIDDTMKKNEEEYEFRIRTLRNHVEMINRIKNEYGEDELFDKIIERENDLISVKNEDDANLEIAAFEQYILCKSNAIETMMKELGWEPQKLRRRTISQSNSSSSSNQEENIREKKRPKTKLIQ